jgi:hypothetical protein
MLPLLSSPLLSAVDRYPSETPPDVRAKITEVVAQIRYLQCNPSATASGRLSLGKMESAPTGPEVLNASEVGTFNRNIC